MPSNESACGSANRHPPPSKRRIMAKANCLIMKFEKMPHHSPCGELGMPRKQSNEKNGKALLTDLTFSLF